MFLVTKDTEDTQNTQKSVFFSKKKSQIFKPIGRNLYTFPSTNNWQQRE